MPILWIYLILYLFTDYEAYNSYRSWLMFSYENIPPIIMINEGNGILKYDSNTEEFIIVKKIINRL